MLMMGTRRPGVEKQRSGAAKEHRCPPSAGWSSSSGKEGTRHPIMAPASGWGVGAVSGQLIADRGGHCYQSGCANHSLHPNRLALYLGGKAKNTELLVIQTTSRNLCLSILSVVAYRYAT